MDTLKTVLHITQDAHSCATYEMYDYDWRKLVIAWVLTTSSTHPPEGKEIGIINT